MTWKRDAAMVALGGVVGWLLGQKTEKGAKKALTGEVVLETDEEDDFDYALHDGEVVGYIFPDAEREGWWARLQSDGSDSPTFDTKEEAIEWLRQS